MIAISGKPGGGKSFYAVQLIMEELLKGKRTIITNIPLQLHRIQAYCVSIDRADIDVYSRILIIPWEQAGEFWRYRAVDYTYAGEVSANEGGYEKVFKSFPATSCFYVIDEAHEYFNSQEYKNLSKFTLAYIAKHRHLQDEVIWISQALGSVALDFRRRVQDFRYCRNWAKERFGVFSKGSGLKVYSYLYQFDEQKGEVTSNPLQWSKSYKLDKSANFYSTSLHNRSAEEVKKRPHYGILIFGICTIGILVVWGVLQGPKYLWSKALPPADVPAMQTSNSTLTNPSLPPTGGNPNPKGETTVSKTQLQLISKVDLSRAINMFENTTCFYDSSLQKSFISTSLPTQVIAFVANAQRDIVERVYGDFSGYVALASNGYSWADDLGGIQATFGNENYKLGQSTKYGKAKLVENNKITLDNNGNTVLLLPKLETVATAVIGGLVPPVQLPSKP